MKTIKFSTQRIKADSLRKQSFRGLPETCCLCLYSIFSIVFLLCAGTLKAEQDEEAQYIQDPSDSFASHSFNKALALFNKERWESAIREFRFLAINYSHTSYGQEARFYLGVCYYNLSEFDRANRQLDKYFECQSNPRYFNEAIQYKFHIARSFREGAKKHLLGFQSMPKWGSGNDLAIEIYEEIIPVLPPEQAVEACFGKAFLLHKQRRYRESVDTYQMVIGRFPKSPYAADSFLAINRVYLEQCQREFQNPDLLALAEINLRRFEEYFPGEERLECARDEFLQIKEVYAQGLYDTALFYERIKKPQAAVIYYQQAIVNFPETQVAQRARCRLSVFRPEALEEIEP